MLDRHPSPRPVRIAIATGALILTALSGCAFGPPDNEVGGQPPNLTPPPTTAPPAEAPGAVATVIADGLDYPWGIAFRPDETALVTERGSRRILRIDPASDNAVSVVQTVEEVRPGGEGGLLGIAVSPDYATDGLIFIYYTTDTDNRIGKLTLGGSPVPIVTGIPKAGIHNGGRLAFGPDGYLYASTGDAGDTNRSQDLSSLGGKILRFSEDGDPAPGNPFPQAPLVWTYGHRNVQGLAWDADGRMFATEFGQNLRDEVNRIEAGNNYGWPIVEGISGNPAYTDPIQDWATSEASCSGAAVAGDVLVAACLRGQRLWLLPLGEDGNLAGEPVTALHTEFGRLRAATVAPDGSLWVSTSNGSSRDQVLRVVITNAGGISVL